MQSSQMLNLGSTPSESIHHESPSVPETYTQTDELVEQTRSDVRRLRTQLQRQEDETEQAARKTKVLSFILAVLVVVLAGAVWFAYPMWRDQKNATFQMLGLKNIAGSLSENVQSLESKFNKTNAELPALSARVDRLGANMKASLQTARNQAQVAATQMGQRIRADLDQRIQAIQSRMTGLESTQKETSGHVNELEQQIAGLKREIAAMREESTTAAGKMNQLLEEEQKTRTNELSQLNQKMNAHETSLDSIANQIEEKRAGFTIGSRRTEQIAPGISLTINRSDVGKQEVDATVQSGIESRALTIRGQGIQKPFLFYTNAGSRPMQLVFTNVTKAGVSGYVVMPNAEQAAAGVEKTQ